MTEIEIRHGHLFCGRSPPIARFSASNMKGPDIPPGLVVVGGDGVTFVGTGKQNAETLIDVAAGPKPPAKDMH